MKKKKLKEGILYELALVFLPNNEIVEKQQFFIKTVGESLYLFYYPSLKAQAALNKDYPSTCEVATYGKWNWLVNQEKYTEPSEIGYKIASIAKKNIKVPDIEQIQADLNNSFLLQLDFEKGGNGWKKMKYKK